MRTFNQSNMEFPEIKRSDKERLLKLYSSDVIKFERISGRCFKDYKEI